MKKVSEGDFKIPKSVNISSECIDFIEKCLQTNPDNRIKHSEIFLHPFFKNEVITEEMEEAGIRLNNSNEEKKYYHKPDQQINYDDESIQRLQECSDDQKYE